MPKSKKIEQKVIEVAAPLAKQNALLATSRIYRLPNGHNLFLVDKDQEIDKDIRFAIKSEQAVVIQRNDSYYTIHYANQSGGISSKHIESSSSSLAQFLDNGCFCDPPRFVFQREHFRPGIENEQLKDDGSENGKTILELSRLTEAFLAGQGDRKVAQHAPLTISPIAYKNEAEAQFRELVQRYEREQRKNKKEYGDLKLTYKQYHAKDKKIRARIRVLERQHRQRADIFSWKPNLIDVSTEKNGRQITSQLVHYRNPRNSEPNPAKRKVQVIVLGNGNTPEDALVWIQQNGWHEDGRDFVITNYSQHFAIQNSYGIPVLESDRDFSNYLSTAFSRVEALGYKDSNALHHYFSLGGWAGVNGYYNHYSKKTHQCQFITVDNINNLDDLSDQISGDSRVVFIRGRGDDEQSIYMISPEKVAALKQGEIGVESLKKTKIINKSDDHYVNKLFDEKGVSRTIHSKSDDRLREIVFKNNSDNPAVFALNTLDHIAKFVDHQLAPGFMTSSRFLLLSKQFREASIGDKFKAIHEGNPDRKICINTTKDGVIPLFSSLYRSNEKEQSAHLFKGTSKHNHNNCLDQIVDAAGVDGQQIHDEFTAHAFNDERYFSHKDYKSMGYNSEDIKGGVILRAGLTVLGLIMLLTFIPAITRNHQRFLLTISAVMTTLSLAALILLPVLFPALTMPLSLFVLFKAGLFSGLSVLMFSHSIMGWGAISLTMGGFAAMSFLTPNLLAVVGLTLFTGPAAGFVLMAISAVAAMMLCYKVVQTLRQHFSQPELDKGQNHYASKSTFFVSNNISALKTDVVKMAELINQLESDEMAIDVKQFKQALSQGDTDEVIKLIDALSRQVFSHIIDDHADSRFLDQNAMSKIGQLYSKVKAGLPLNDSSLSDHGNMESDVKLLSHAGVRVADSLLSDNSSSNAANSSILSFSIHSRL